MALIALDRYGDKDSKENLLVQIVAVFIVKY